MAHIFVAELGHHLDNRLSPVRNNLMCCKCGLVCHDGVIKWKKYPRYWTFVRRIHRSPVNYPHKGQWRRALLFYLIWAWTNGLVYNWDAGDLRRHRAHYDVTVMSRDGSPHLILLPAIKHVVGSYWSLLEHDNLLKSLLNEIFIHMINNCRMLVLKMHLQFA